RGEPQVDAGRDFLLVELAVLVLIDLLEQRLRGRDQLLERHLAVLVGVGALEDGTGEQIAGPEAAGPTARRALRPTAAGEARRGREDAIEIRGQLILAQDAFLVLVAVREKRLHAREQLVLAQLAV